MLKRINIITIASLLLIGLLTACSQAGNKEGGQSAAADQQTAAPPPQQAEQTKPMVKIGITQIVEHPSLNATQKGIIDALKENGFVQGENADIDVKIAQEPANNTPIAQKFVADKKDMIIAIATPGAQAAVSATRETNIPVIFASVTDPLEAGLVDNMEKPGGRVTGVCDTHPETMPKTAEFIHKYFPNVKKVGYLYNAGEANSVSAMKQIKKELEKYQVELVEATVANSSEVKQAAESLVGEADMFFYSRDNTIASALESVIQVADDNHIPFFAGDWDSVERGAFAAYGFDYYDVGYEAGEMAAEVLKGKNPGDIPVGFPQNVNLAINLDAANKQGVNVTEEMKSEAKVIDGK
jgi:putative ABC transport system substrate-binding protein